MEVVGHEDIAAQLNTVNFEGLDKVFKKSSPVCVVFKDGFLFVPSACDMIHGTRILNAKGSSHEDLIVQARLVCQQ
jgi:hypothetical protein